MARRSSILGIGPLEFTRADFNVITSVGIPTIHNLQAGGVLPKRSGGPGHFNTFDLDDLLRGSVAKELLRVGLQVKSIHSLFQSIQEPVAPAAKSWAWLHTREARELGAALVLVLGHPFGPDPTTTGHAVLTTAAAAVECLRSKRTVIVIDVGAMIATIEERTGQSFET